MSTRRALLVIARPPAFRGVDFRAKLGVEFPNTRCRLEASLRNALVDDTQTFRRVKLVTTSVDWLSRPVQINLFVRSQDPVTATQVGFLQSFPERKIGRPLKLVVEVSQIIAAGAGTSTQ